MMRLSGIIVTVFVAIAIVYWAFFYPPHVKKRATNHALIAFSEAVESKDRAKVTASLTELLAEDAKIRLDVHFFSITGSTPPMSQEFDKASFMKFIDDTLYPLSEYHYTPQLEQFTLTDDSHAEVAFSSREWADGVNYYGGNAVNMRFSSETQCRGTVIFADDSPQLQQANCIMGFRSVPKPGEAAKMKNMDAIKELLQH